MYTSPHPPQPSVLQKHGARISRQVPAQWALVISLCLAAGLAWAQAPAQQAPAAQAGGPQPSAAQPPATESASREPPRPRPAVPGAPCLIAQFRTLALDTHNPTERSVLARQWLQRNLPGCSADKLNLLASNRAGWLGTADSAELMGLIDTALEAQAQNDPSLLRKLYEASPRTFEPGMETIRTEPPRPILQQGGVAAMPPIGMVNIRTDHGAGGSGSGGHDGGGGAAQMGTFNDKHRQLVSEYFSQSYEIGECPVGLIARGGRCQSQSPDKLWKFGETLPRELAGQTRDLPNILAERLGPPTSGSRYVRSGTDVLMLDSADRVVDAITDFGQPAVQRRPAPRPPPAK